jgi:hypothetical protein
MCSFTRLIFPNAPLFFCAVVRLGSTRTDFIEFLLGLFATSFSFLQAIPETLVSTLSDSLSSRSVSSELRQLIESTSFTREQIKARLVKFQDVRLAQLRVFC